MDPRYPVGKFQRPQSLSQDDRRRMIGSIEETPRQLREVLGKLSKDQFEQPYRPEGWNARQVVHHLADSHMNAYIRFKLALTEDQPRIKPYEQSLWAQLPDSESTPIEVSLQLLESLHQRWVNLLRAMTPEEFERTLDHPEEGILTLDVMLALYEWHGRHHIAHIGSILLPATA